MLGDNKFQIHAFEGYVNVFFGLKPFAIGPKSNIFFHSISLLYHTFIP